MVVGFALSDVDAIQDDSCRIREHLHIFREVKCVQDYSNIFKGGYIKLEEF